MRDGDGAVPLRACWGPACLAWPLKATLAWEAWPGQQLPQRRGTGQCPATLLLLGTPPKGHRAADGAMVQPVLSSPTDPQITVPLGAGPFVPVSPCVPV